MVLIISCKTKKSISPANYKGEMIVVGNGGGFTGISTSYFLLKNGEVFRSGMSDTSYIKVGKIEKKIIDQQFSIYKDLHFQKVKLDDPGNRYHFMSIRQNGEENKLQWGRSELENPLIGVYHDNIMKLIKSLQPQEK